MDSNEHIAVAGSENIITEAELELLIAKYTLEYLYRWTNQFEPTELSRIKQLLDTAADPKVVIKMLTGGRTLLPS